MGSLEKVDSSVHASKKRRAQNFMKLRRVMRRMVSLSRVARRQGNPDFNIGGLVFEVSKKKELDTHTIIPSAWIEIVIS